MIFEVSVIIPYTGKPDFLNEAIASVMQQSFQSFEVVLVDNHATEDSREMADSWICKYSDKIRLVSETKKGAAAARNRGILESQGEFIAFLDSDDRMKPHRLSRQWEAIKGAPDVSLLGSWKDIISPDGQTISRNDKPQIPRWASLLFDSDPRFRQDPLLEPQTSTFFFRKQRALEIGLFDVGFDPFWLEDTDFVLRMYQRGRVVIIPESMIEYRTHSSQDDVKRIYDFKNIENHGFFFDKLKKDYLGPDSPEMFRRFQKLASRWLREAGTKIAWFPSGESIARTLLERARQNDWTDIRNWEYPFRFSLPKSIWPVPFAKPPDSHLVLPDHIDREWAETYLVV